MKTLRITSYINNLHPQRHRDLYSIIEKIITCAIPLWNTTLSWQKMQRWYDPEKPPFIGDKEFFCYNKRIGIARVFREERGDEPVQGEGEDAPTFWERHNQWFNAR